MTDAPDLIDLTVNGEPRTAPRGSTVADLVASLQLLPQQVAVERNRLIVRRADHAATVLEPGDQLEIVTFFGGG
ncbi:MAG: sulfur carrier protein ThiS [Planctomycetes bacterium]|nr:sulfur carrier protein ThiS [Planctomycetota bacterium]